MKLLKKKRGCIFVKGTGFSTRDACGRRFVKIHSNCRATLQERMDKWLSTWWAENHNKNHLAMYGKWINIVNNKQ